MSPKTGKAAHAMRRGGTRSALVCAACAWGMVFAGATTRAAEVPLFEAWRATGPYRIYVDGMGVHDDGGVGTFQDVNITGPVAKAYLYWAGANLPATDTSTDLTVTFTRDALPGTPVSADASYVVPFEQPLSPGSYFWDANHSAFVADVTELIAQGSFDYTVSDFDMDQEYGIGLQIVYQDREVEPTEIAIHQGHDYAFSGWADGGELNRTNVVTHTFDPAPLDRLLEVSFFAAGGEATDRPDQLWFATGVHETRSDLPTELITTSLGTVIESNPLEGTGHDEWDTIVEKIVVPAGETYAAFQFQSGGGSGTGNPPESFSWLSATFAMRPVPEPATAILFGAGAIVLLRRRRQA